MYIFQPGDKVRIKEKYSSYGNRRYIGRTFIVSHYEQDDIPEHEDEDVLLYLKGGDAAFWWRFELAGPHLEGVPSETDED